MIDRRQVKLSSIQLLFSISKRSEFSSFRKIVKQSVPLSKKKKSSFQSKEVFLSNDKVDFDVQSLQRHQFRHANLIKDLIDVMNQSFQISSQIEYSKHFSQQQRQNKKQRRFSIKFLNIVDENDTSNFI